jgi:Na+/proline symporter
MKVVPITRLFTIAMAGVLAFGVIVPIAVKEHRTSLAVGISAVFLAYLVVNAMLWKRMNRRA